MSARKRRPRHFHSHPMHVCFLKLFGFMEHGDPMPPCDGQLVKAHLIPASLIHRTARSRELSPSAERAAIWDKRVWVWACGGPMGNGGHHGMLDHSKTLRLPRAAIPDATEAFAQEWGLEWWLDRNYGEKTT